MPTAVEAPPTGELIHIPITKIIENPNNVRNGSSEGFDDKSLNELADSIFSVGLIEPLIVYGGDDGTYQLLAGARRRRACGLLVETKRWKKTQTVPCLTRGARVSDGDQVMLALIENLQRVDISPMDEARGYRQLVDEHGWTQADLARSVGRASGHITKRLALLTIDPKFEAFIAKGTVTLETAYEISQLPEKKQKLLLKKLVDQGSISADSFEYSVRAATTDVKTQAAKVKFDKVLEKAMIEPVKEWPKGTDRNQYTQVGRFDASNIKDYKAARNHIAVRDSYSPTSITVYRPRTKADLAKIAKQNEAWRVQRESQEQERVAEMNPHQLWERECRAQDDVYREQLNTFSAAVNNMTGDYVKELAPKDAGKLAMAMVASFALESAKAAATRLAIPPVTTDSEGNPLNEWDYDYETPLMEWVDGDVSKLVKVWIAGKLKADTIRTVKEFAPFVATLEEQGIVTPVRPERPAEPWINTESGEWSTDPHPEGDVDAGGDEDLEYIEEDVSYEHDLDD